MKAVNVDEVLKILHKYGKYIFVTDEKRYSSMVDEIANLKALEQESCSDAISRQTVLDMQYRIDDSATLSSRDVVNVDDIEDLPSVQPKLKTGHWYIDERPESDREVICSNCEQPIFKYHKMDFDYRPKYCPNCGAKMVEDTGSEG